MYRTNAARITTMLDARIHRIAVASASADFRARTLPVAATLLADFSVTAT
jgi:hypothetical protein